jgi:hypothetical protein
MLKAKLSENKMESSYYKTDHILKLGATQCNFLFVGTLPLTPTQKSWLYHVVLDSLVPRISWTCWWRERPHMNQKLNLNCPSYILFFSMLRCKERLLASSCLSVHKTVPLHGTIWLPLHLFSWKLVSQYFSKTCWKNSSFFTIGQK